MNSRQRTLAAIRREPIDRVPVDCINLENQPETAAYLGIDSPEVRSDLRPMMDHYPQVFEQLGIDGRRAWLFYNGESRQGPGGERLNEWGAIEKLDYGSAHWYPLGDAASISDIEKHPWPKVEDYDFARTAAIAREFGGEYAVRSPGWMPLFCTACDLMGMETAMINMACSPKLFEAVLEEIFQRVAECCRRLLDACGDDLPILWLGDDFATQRGMMISPEHWRRFLKPLYARLFEIGKQAGKVVWFHSCGDTTEVLPDLIDIGMDVWETIQLHTLPISPQQLKQQFGRQITFFGGVNTQRLPFATPNEVRREVQACIEALGGDGGYICGPDHIIKPDVSPENTVALFEAARNAPSCKAASG